MCYFESDDIEAILENDHTFFCGVFGYLEYGHFEAFWQNCGTYQIKNSPHEIRTTLRYTITVLVATRLTVQPVSALHILQCSRNTYRPVAMKASRLKAKFGT